MKSSWKLALGLWAVLMLFSAGLFHHGLENPFVFDDVAKIRDNPDLHLSSFSLDNFIHDYSRNKTDLHNDPSRPLTFFFYWVLWQIGNGDTLPFHLAGILFHALSAFLVGWITFRISRKLMGHGSVGASLFASLWFLALPLNAGTVIYAYGFSDVLAAFFCLLLTALALRSGNLTVLDSIVISLCYTAAVFSKQSALVMPAIFLVTDWFLRDPQDLRKRWRLYGLLFFLAAVYVLWRFLYFGRIGDLEAYNTFPVLIYAPLQGIMIWKYFAWVWVPLRLSIDQAFNQTMYDYWQCWLSWGVIFVLSLLALFKGRSNALTRVLSWGWLFFLAALMPTSSLFPTTDLLVERRAYLAVAGLCIAFMLALEWFLQNFDSRAKIAVAALLSLLLLANSVMTTERVRVYGNEEALWMEGKSHFPRNERARINLITYYLKTENFTRAEEELNEILQMYPQYFEALTNLGAYYQHPRNPRRDPTKSLDAYRRALQQEPNDITSLMNMAVLWVDLNQAEQALPVFEKVASLSPNFLQAHLGVAITALRLGQIQKARAEAQSILKLDPGNQNALGILSRTSNQ